MAYHQAPTRSSSLFSLVGLNSKHRSIAEASAAVGIAVVVSKQSLRPRITGKPYLVAAVNQQKISSAADFGGDLP